MEDQQAGITIDPLAVGLTRPSMVWGVAYPALVINTMVSLEALIWTHKLQWGLIFLPVHGICYGICLHDPRAFELLILWLQTKAANLFRTRSLVSTYSPLVRRKRAGLLQRLRLNWRRK